MTNTIRRIQRVLLAGLVCALLAPAASAAQSLNGTWNLLSKGGPHGDMQFQVTFTEGSGPALGAVMTLFGHEIEMTGEVKDGAFTVKGDHSGSVLTLRGKFKADGMLEGFLSGEQGDLIWTGTRAKQ